MKKTRSFSVPLFILLMVLICLCGRAQEGFAYRSELDTVTQAGFYRITLRPEMLAKCKEDLSDLRILDQAGNFLPYAVKIDSTVNRDHILVPYPGIAQIDSSDKHSYITLQYRDHYRIDGLFFVFKGPEVSRRNAFIYDQETGGNRLIARITLNPAHTSFPVTPVKSDKLLLVIANENEKPLILELVQTTQLNHYMLAWLEPGTGYVFVEGNANAQAPKYDLKNFADNLTKDPP